MAALPDGWEQGWVKRYLQPEGVYEPPTVYYAAIALPRYVKRGDETWNEYLARVPDALDNPAIRWEYQKHIWGYPLRLMVRLRKWHDRGITKWIF